MISVKQVSKIRVLGEIIFISLFSIGIAYLGRAVMKAGIPVVSNQMVIGPIIMYTILGMIVFMQIILNKSSLKEIGFTFRPIIKGTVIGLLMGIASWIIFDLLIFPTPIQDFIKYEDSLGNTIIGAIYFYACIALVEEAVYRGYIFTRLNQAFQNKPLVVLLTALSFMLSHLNNLNVQRALGTFVITIAFCIYLYKAKNKSLLPLIIAHGFYDSSSMWIALVLSYI